MFNWQQNDKHYVQLGRPVKFALNHGELQDSARGVPPVVTDMARHSLHNTNAAELKLVALCGSCHLT